MKRFVALLFVLFILILSPGATSAQDSKMIVPPEIRPPQLFGQQHAYSVTMRGNGETVVSARLIVTNLGDTPMRELVLRIPRVEPKDLVAFQVLKEPRCIRYRTLLQTPDVYVDGSSRPSACEQYEEPNYQYVWDGSPTKYQKAQLALKTDTITVTLPKEIKSNASGSIILYYRATGYAKKTLFGSYNFTFESLKAEDPIGQLQVGISTDSDLYLRGAKSKVNYRLEESGVAMKALDMNPAPMANAQFDQYYQQIGQGDIVKTAKDLQPLDSYTMKGSYADSLLKLYGNEIAIGVVVFLLVTLLAFFGIRALLAKSREANKSTTDTKTWTLVAVFGLSFASAVLMVGLTVAIVIIMKALTNTVPYDSQMLLTLMVAIVSFGVYGLLLFAPGLYLGLKRGPGYGLATAGLTLLWLLIGLFIFAFVFLLGSQQSFPYRGGVMPMLEKAVGVGSAQTDTIIPDQPESAPTTNVAD